MIRLFFLIILPLVLPFAAWFLWKVFVASPADDAATLDEALPEVEKMPARMLLIVGVCLSVVTIAGFFLVQHAYEEKPYTPINVEEYEKRMEREQQRLRAGERQ